MNFKAIAVAAALLASVGAAQADNINKDVNLTGGPVKFTTDFGTSHVNGLFTDTFTFKGYNGKGLAAGFFTNFTAFGTDIDFTSATLNGISLDVENIKKYSGASFDNVGFDGVLTLVVSGVSKGAASYSGTLDLVAAPVPEPTTYGMMLGGMGVLAFLARRRKQG
ncbi:FxDxF family PEP-CTERM protein [Pseudoduganella violacea]|uniref:Ice-binding protein C-terminal domain-containing protein n=1 Tax=Pseudoduganella violacea TaxID=1715466 RepID=A0A7W5FWZ1_9BURK|nr:FxDxF family PEP-CTERM protein [Pseudoduganella violacea]MBB3122346.1 hypothetical protein [Pseudoduganella violacea]